MVSSEGCQAWCLMYKIPRWKVGAKGLLFCRVKDLMCGLGREISVPFTHQGERWSLAGVWKADVRTGNSPENFGAQRR